LGLGPTEKKKETSSVHINTSNEKEEGTYVTDYISMDDVEQLVFQEDVILTLLQAGRKKKLSFRLLMGERKDDGENQR